MNQEPELRNDPGDRPAAPRERTAGWLLVVAALVIGGVLAAWLWRARQLPVEHAAVAVPAAPVPQAPAPRSAPAASAPLHPLAEPAEVLRSEDVPAALARLLGPKSVATFLQTDGFARRAVATLDNLGRAHAPVAAWPVFPTGGRFLVEEQPGGTVIAADNAARYTPFMLLLGTLDVPQTVALYRSLYPLLQQTYRELGFGDRYLNDRVVEVIDLLLATPEPSESPRLVLTEVKGPIASTRPWVRYEFADPELEALAAGQKILVRIGLVNERRVKTKLAELRAHIVDGGAQPAVEPSPAASAPAAPVPGR